MARVHEAEARAAQAEKALREAEKRAQERGNAQGTGSTAEADKTPETAQSVTEDDKEADGGNAGAGGARMSIMAALCGLK